MRVRRTRHFAEEQANDGITEEEIVRAWTEPEFDRLLRTILALVYARPRSLTALTVVAMQRDDVLEFITTWRS